MVVAGDVKLIGGNNATKFCFKNCSPFTRSVVHLNDIHIETDENLQLVMNHYKLIEYSDNYQDSVGSLYNFKRNEQALNAAGKIIVVTIDNSSSFKYNSNLLTGLATEDGAAGANAYRIYKNAQIVVPLKYISSFFRSAEIPLINTTLHLELSWTKNSIISNVAGDSTFQVTKIVVTLNTDNNLKLTKLLNKGFKRSVF